MSFIRTGGETAKDGATKKMIKNNLSAKLNFARNLLSP